MLKKILNFLKSLFASDKKPVQNPPQINPEQSGVIVDSENFPEPDYTKKVTLELINQAILFEAAKYVGAKEKGINTDKGGIIDRIILSMGGKLGHAWCAYFVSYVVSRVCKNLGISYPQGLYKGGSSQAFWHKTAKKYIVKIANRAFAFVYTYPGQSSHGHIGLCRNKAKLNWSLETIEGNASDAIRMKIQPPHLVKEVSCYIDIPQAIFDQYYREKMN